MKPIRAYDPKKKKWYTWSWVIPKNIISLIKEEGLILGKRHKHKIKNNGKDSNRNDQTSVPRKHDISGNAY